MATTITAAAADAMSAALNTYINSGGAAKIRIYDATGGAPANATASLGSCVLLADFALSNPAFTSSGGVLTLAGTPKTVAASASGTASFFRILLNNGTTVVLQGTVGTSGQQLNLNTLAITQTVNVTITSGTITMPLL
jgi:hypothetical protein